MNPAEAVSIPQPFAKSANRARVAAAATATAVVVPALVIVSAALAIRVGFGPQLDGLDDAGYLNAAHRVAHGVSLDDVFPLFRTRVAMAYPLGWMIGHGWLEPSHFWALTLFAEVVTMVSLLAAGWLLSGRRSAGVWAAMLYACYPLAIQQSALYYPTAFQVASIASACALIAYAERLTGLGRMLAGASAGLALGVGYLFKEDVAIVVPAIALASLIARFPRPGTAIAVCAGAAGVFAIECAGYWLTTGMPLFRLSATSGLGAPVGEQLQIAGLWRWDAYLRSLFLLPAAVGMLWWCGVPAAIWAWRSRYLKPLFFVAVLLAIVMAYLQFGSGSLSSYSPLPKSPRYTALATPLLMVLVGAWLAHLFAVRRRVAVIVAALVVVAAIPCVFYLNVSSSERARNTLAAAPVVAALAPSPVFTDYYTARILRLLLPGQDIRVWFHADFRSNTTYVQETPAPGSLVLLDQQAAKVYTSSYELTLPREVASAASWDVLWTQRAYADGSLTRALLDGTRRAATRLPAATLGDRIDRNVADMIDGDRATLYRVP